MLPVNTLCKSKFFPILLPMPSFSFSFASRSVSRTRAAPPSAIFARKTKILLALHNLLLRFDQGLWMGRTLGVGVGCSSSRRLYSRLVKNSNREITRRLNGRRCPRESAWLTLPLCGPPFPLTLTLTGDGLEGAYSLSFCISQTLLFALSSIFLHFFSSNTAALYLSWVSKTASAKRKWVEKKRLGIHIWSSSIDFW